MRSTIVRFALIGAALIGAGTAAACGAKSDAPSSVTCDNTIKGGKPAATYIFTIAPVTHDQELGLDLYGKAQVLTRDFRVRSKQAAGQPGTISYTVDTTLQGIKARVRLTNSDTTLVDQPVSNRCPAGMATSNR
jgi:hypothetical protein